MQNKFKIVIPSYNNEKWLEANLASILNQTYTNYEVLYIDDASTDETYSQVTQIVGDLPNWRIARNATNMRRGYNLSPYNPLIIDFMEDGEEILLFVDGDDWLYEEDTLEKMNQFYNENDSWMTYGAFICYPTGDIGNPQNTPYPDEVHLHNAYRLDTWRASHLRTFKWHLYQQIKKEDLIFSKTGEFYYHAEDLAVSFPCLEMCPKDKIGVVPFLTYVYNVSQEARARVESDRTREPEGYHYEVAIREQEVRAKKPYEQLGSDLYIANVLSGGLGNMMFQLAAACALGKRHGHTLLLNPNHVGTIHKMPLEYHDTVFQNIAVADKPMELYKINEESYTYAPLGSIKENILLNGYFQSYKYFEEHADDIRKLFNFSIRTSGDVLTKYLVKNAVSLHVRRGNYTKLSEHHHNLSMQYYLNAIDYFDKFEFALDEPHKFLVFSDDIEWCKENFKGDKFIFVEDLSDVESLYLMQHCQYSIIANSTFSWWGAWLYDQKRNTPQVVVYPDRWFGPANADFKTWDLFPDEWVCLSEEVPKVTINLIDSAFVHLAKPNGRYSSVHDKISKEVKYVRRRGKYDGITVFTDQHLMPNNIESKHRIGWLLETREVNPGRYEEFPNYMNEFDFVMTHDEELLTKYPEKTKFTVFGGTWIKTKNYGVHPKTKNISMIYSDKQHMTGHKLRHEVAQKVQGVDLYGRGTPRPLEQKEDALVDYRYSIVIENAKTQNYFTEKLVDCFMVGTIPIYWGCPNIGDFFDTEGMIIVNSVEEIEQVVGGLCKSSYSVGMKHIENNFSIAQKYAVTEDWMYHNIYKHLK